MLVNQPQTEAELDVTGRCVARGRPYGGEPWGRRTAEQLGLETTLRAPRRERSRRTRLSPFLLRTALADRSRLNEANRGEFVGKPKNRANLPDGDQVRCRSRRTVCGESPRRMPRCRLSLRGG